VRPIGERDRQPFAPPHPPQFFWVWTPVNLAGRSVFFHLQADAAGGVLGTRAVLCPDGAGPDGRTEIADADETLRFGAGTRWPETASVRIRPPGEPELTLDFEPLARFHMQGIGYGHPAWGPGRHHGELVLEREDVVSGDADPAAASELHVHTIARVTAAQDGVTETGVGTLETIVIGPYAPYGFVDVTGPAREG
jgi:hypothetical protein